MSSLFYTLLASLSHTFLSITAPFRRMSAAPNLSVISDASSLTPMTEGYWTWEGTSERFVLRATRPDEEDIVGQKSIDRFCTIRSHMSEKPSDELSFHGGPSSYTPALPFSAVFQQGPPTILPLDNQSPLQTCPIFSEDGDTSVGKVNGELSADTSLVSDSSDDDLDSSLDSSMLSTPVRPLSSPGIDTTRGLGILGVLKKDGHEIFDGLGIVSLRSSPWRHGDGLEERQQDSFQDEHITSGSISNNETPFAEHCDISQTLLQETLFTFNEDPFHGHSLTVIPECDSWYEIEGLHRPSSPGTMTYRNRNLEYHDLGVMASTPTLNFPSESSFEQTRKPVTLSRNIAAPTISSALKRSTSLHCYRSPRDSIAGCTTRSLSTSLSGNQVTGKTLRSLSRSGSPLPPSRCATPLPSPSGGTPRWRV